MAKYNCHIISNTHWDREWRYPYQTYRMDLVDMLDRLLDILRDNPKYCSFFLDSQTVVLEDYLEIRPENKERIQKFVKDDRLQIGPWYTLPDAWGCHGEALVRNLLLGHQTAEKLGGVSKVGYTPFSNGQVSQLPQIYQGFGIDSCFFYRGISKHIAKSEFIWKSPDGTQVYGFRFGDYARYNYYYLVYREGLMGRTMKDREYQWNPDDIPFHIATKQNQDRQYSWLNLDLRVREEMIDPALEDARKNTRADATTSELLYMMGHDHSFASTNETDLIEVIQSHIDPEDEAIFHSRLTDYMDAFRKEAKDLQVLEGEMRHTLKEGLWTTLMANILSCRLYLKQENQRICNHVLYVSEPLASYNWVRGKEYPQRYFELAWKQLLINHAHDAIGGCSVDPVHFEMQARWSEVRALSDEITRRSLRDLITDIDSPISPEDYQLTVFNTLPYSRASQSEFIIDIPITNDNEAADFMVEDMKGNQVEQQVLSSTIYDPTIESGYELTMPFKVMRHRTLLACNDLPAYGHQVLCIKRSNDEKECHTAIASGHSILENSHLKAEVQPNGTLTLKDKDSGKTFENLGFFEDSAEFGDPWNRIIDEANLIQNSLDCHAESYILYNGELEGCIRTEMNFPVPMGKNPDSKTRSMELVQIPITIDYKLKKNANQIEMRIALKNRAKDHRLRIHFPTGLANATSSWADGQFDVLKRPIKVPDGTDFIEAPYATHPMWNFVDVSDHENGFAVINDGLIEYEVVDDADRSIAVTLMRCFGKFVYSRPTPGSQCQGKHVYHFAICPHQGTWKEGELFQKTYQFLTPIQAIQSAPTKGKKLGVKQSIINIDNKIVNFGAIKPTEDQEGLLVRLWNPSSEAQPITLSSDLEIEAADLLSLEEISKGKQLQIENGCAQYTIAAKRIDTVRIKFKD